jgi:FHA domain-containing protein
VRDPNYVPTGEGYEVILESRPRGGVPVVAGVRLTKSDLEHGVLIGRADKCVDEGLRSILGTTVSRVHVLLIREKGACHLYDCASLVGTYSDGQRVRCLPLDDHGTTAQLASSAGVTLHWRAL